MALLRVPELGESIVEATVGAWLKNVGEFVTAGEAVVELETDKVNVEVIAESDGVLQSVEHPVGETVGPGDVLGQVAAEGTPVQAQSSDNSGGAPLGDITVDKGTSVPDPPDNVTQGGADAKGNAQESVASNVMKGAVNSSTAARMPQRATPAMRRLATQQGIPLEALVGGLQESQTSGSPSQQPGNSHGRHLEGVQSKSERGSASTAGLPATAFSSDLPQREEHVRLSRRRLTIAKRLVEAQHTAAMLTTFNEVDMSAVMDVRKRRKEAFRERHAVGLGFMSFFTKAVVGALKTIPQLNAEIRGDEMILKHYYDIGIAVATEGGLVVPVVREADRLSFAQIEQRIASLATSARNNQLGLDDLRGGTFTITNGGTFGSLLSTPILNPPQVGILGMHKIEERPVGVDGRIELRPMMYVALSYDHRIVDGAEAVRFLVRVKELLEDPEQLWLEG